MGKIGEGDPFIDSDPLASLEIPVDPEDHAHSS